MRVEGGPLDGLVPRAVNGVDGSLHAGAKRGDLGVVGLGGLVVGELVWAEEGPVAVEGEEADDAGAKGQLRLGGGGGLGLGEGSSATIGVGGGVGGGAGRAPGAVGTPVAVQVNTVKIGANVPAAVLPPETVVGPGEDVAVGVEDDNKVPLEGADEGRGPPEGW